MLPTTNKTISILQLTAVTGSTVKRNWDSVQDGVRVYINQIQEDLVPWYDGSGSFFAYRMLTKGNHETINVNDRVVDEDSVTYTVKGKSTFKDMTGTHHQYIMIVTHD